MEGKKIFGKIKSAPGKLVSWLGEKGRRITNGAKSGMETVFKAPGKLMKKVFGVKKNTSENIGKTMKKSSKNSKKVIDFSKKNIVETFGAKEKKNSGGYMGVLDKNIEKGDVGHKIDSWKEKEMDFAA